MKDLPILKYNDLREVMWLDHHNSLNGVVVDDASLEVMLRIEKIMSRLDVMGDDNKRWLWIGIDANRLQYLYPTQYDVGVDNTDFCPVSFEKIRQNILISA